MEPGETNGLAEAISSERFARYLGASGGDATAAIRLYAWNIEISSAFLGPLHCLEVVLRNAVHRELSSHFGRSDWWAARTVRLAPKEAAKVRRAKQVTRFSQNPTVGHVVADLSLGFWVALLGNANDYETRLWRPALHRAFPGYRGRRRPLHQDLYHLRHFRNRIAHCEPIHGRHLAADHATLLKVIDFVSPQTADCVRRCDRVPEVLARRTAVCDGSASARF